MCTQLVTWFLYMAVDLQITADIIKVVQCTVARMYSTEDMQINVAFTLDNIVLACLMFFSEPALLILKDPLPNQNPAFQTHLQLFIFNWMEHCVRSEG